MNTAEEIWSDRRAMVEVAQFRKKNYRKTPIALCKCSDKFTFRSASSENFLVWFSDVFRCDTIGERYRNQKIKSISTETSIDLFGYSIGSFLSMILKMADPEGIFENSKLFCFCWNDD